MNRASHAPRRQRTEPENPFWISYSDLMTALTIMLILMVSAFLLRVHQEKKRLDEQMRIPGQSDHRFRRNPITDSDAKRSPIPAETDHLTGLRRNG